MIAVYDPPRRERLHTRITAELARRVIDCEQRGEPISFPREADLCLELGVSRTVLRESMKVLTDKGMVEMKPRAGTRARPRSYWRLLDPDILTWQAQANPDGGFLRDLCEVRLAIEPTAAGFAAVRATRAELQAIDASLREREARAGKSDLDAVTELDVSFHAAVVAASHNELLCHLSAVIREPFRIAAACTARYPATLDLGLEAHRKLLAALRERDPMAARKAAEEVVGMAMLAVEKAIRSSRTPKEKLK